MNHPPPYGIASTTRLGRAATLWAVALMAGCAPAYHSYCGTHVPCRYAPPPPLPYQLYASHDCSGPFATKSLPETVPGPAPAPEAGPQDPPGSADQNPPPAATGQRSGNDTES